ncbi:MAG TPA: hypothetical protein VGI74_15640 [Streptosporangiaceae bacterium]
MHTQSARLDQAVRLADGRVLGYAEYGPAAGPPLFTAGLAARHP